MGQTEIVTFEVASLARKAGFDWPTQFSYNSTRGNKATLYGGRYKNDLPGKVQYIIDEQNYNSIEISSGPHDADAVWSAPTQSQLQKWLREVHNIHINIISKKKGITKLNFTGWLSTLADRSKYRLENRVYEDLLEELLKEGIEILL